MHLALRIHDLISPSQNLVSKVFLLPFTEEQNWAWK